MTRPRYIIEEINGLFYISLGRFETRNGLPIRVDVFATRAVAEAKLAEWS